MRADPNHSYAALRLLWLEDGTTSPTKQFVPLPALSALPAPPRPGPGCYLKAEWSGRGQSAEVARARRCVRGASHPVTGSPRSVLLIRVSLARRAPSPRRPGPADLQTPGPERIALGAFPGSAEGFPAGISGVALAMRSEERRGVALRARGGGMRSPGSPGRRWGTRASEPKRDLRVSRTQRPGLPALWPWMESGEWGRGLRTP